MNLLQNSFPAYKNAQSSLYRVADSGDFVNTGADPVRAWETGGVSYPGKNMKRIRKIFTTDKSDYLNEAVLFVHNFLTDMGIEKKQVLKNELLFEETLARFVQHANDNKQFRLDIRHFMGEISVTLSMQGDGFDIYSEEHDDNEVSEDSFTTDAIRAVLLKAYGENFKYSNKNGVNRVRILIDNSKKALYATFYAMLLGIIAGLVAQFLLPEVLRNGLKEFILLPVRTMFMSGIKIIIAPVVFFSLVTCFTQYDDISQFGKLGIKVLSMYLLTTVIAIFLALGLSSIFKPGEFGFALNKNIEIAQVSVNTNVDTSLLNTIVGIVPSNFLAPFLESSTLQLILLAVLCGISLGILGDTAVSLKEMIESLNSLFLTITSLIAKFIPVAAFCSLALLIMDLDLSAFVSLLEVTVLQITSSVSMMIIYGILILLIGRLNPLKFYKKAKEGMITSFSLASSSASVPTNQRICIDKMGISPTVANFSIPLGATINMDGTCILLTIMGLFLARAYGVEITSSDIMSVFLTIILLSLGAPGVPGSGLVCIGIILEVLHVPVEALGIIIPIYPLFDMFDTMSNVTGDMAASLIVARSEKLLNMEVYNE